MAHPFWVTAHWQPNGQLTKLQMMLRSGSVTMAALIQPIWLAVPPKQRNTAPSTALSQFDIDEATKEMEKQKQKKKKRKTRS